LKKFLTFIFALLFLFKLVAINQTDMDKIVKFYSKYYQSPDISVGLFQNNHFYFSTNKQDSLGLKAFPIGDLTSGFTAYLVLKLSENGTINLDRTVEYYLPWFTLKNKEAAKLITVRNLLNQTSGFSRDFGFSNINIENQDQIQSFLSKVDLVDEPGSEFHYSALNYQLLGLIITTISGKKYSELLNEYISAPLKLQNTKLVNEQLETYGYQYWFGIPLYSRKLNRQEWSIPASGIQSCTKDLLIWSKFMLNESRIDIQQLLKPEKFELLFRPKYFRYAMGWYSGNWENNDTYFHWGIKPNYSSRITLLPNDQSSIVILSNINSLTMVDNLNDSLLQLMLNNKKLYHFPYEIFFRILYLFWSLWTLYELYVYIKLWRKFKFPIHFNFNFFSYYQVFVGVLIPLSWLYIIPKVTSFPISNIMYAQPDLAFCLIISVISGILIVILKMIIKNRHRSVKYIAKQNQ